MEESETPAGGRTEQSGPGKRPIGKYCTYAFLLLVVVFIGAIRFRLRSMPLERDEGEYAYAGQLMLQGIPPYQLAYTMKLPGTQVAYAVTMALFGQTTAGIHIGLLLVSSATTLLVYLLAECLSGPLAGLVAATSYGILSTSVSVLGLAAHAMHFVVLFALAGILLLLKAMETGRMWQFLASGFSLGMAFLMKQPGIAFAAFGGLYLLHNEWTRPTPWKRLFSRLGCYAMGVALPLALTCLILFVAGVFRNFWFWVFIYASQYTSEVGFSRGLRVLTWIFPKVVGPTVGLWIIAGLGLASLLWLPENRRHAILIGGLLLFSFLAVCPGFYFRNHYFILMLPAVALLTGIAVHSATQALSRRTSWALTAVPVLLFLAASTFAVVQQADLWFEMDPLRVIRFQYGSNPFAEAVVVAQYLSAHTSPSDRVAVLGSEPEIYFYAKRRSASGFIYVYGLMEPQKYALEMQKQMIGEIESAQPRYLVFVRNFLSWLPRKGSPQEVSMSAWLSSYLTEYELVGIAESVGNRVESHWDEEAKSYLPRSENVVGVFKRKN